MQGIVTAFPTSRGVLASLCLQNMSAIIWRYFNEPPRPPPIGYPGIYDPRWERMKLLWVVTFSAALGALCTLVVQSLGTAHKHEESSYYQWSPPPPPPSSAHLQNATRYTHTCDRTIPFLDNVQYTHLWELVAPRSQDETEELCLRALATHPHGGWYQRWSHLTICAAFTGSARRGFPLLAEGIEFGAVCIHSKLLIRAKRPRPPARGRCLPPMTVSECSRAVIAAVKRRRWLVSSPLELAARSEARVAQRRPGVSPDQQLWLEFGAWSGKSTRELSDERYVLGRTAPLFSFDSFLGLPEDWRPAAMAGRDARTAFERSWLRKGSFDRAGMPPFTSTPRLNVEWVTGWYNQTLPGFLRAHPENVSLVHVDCDLYSSSEYVLRHLEPRLAPSCILCFDELINYPEYAQHELRALAELLVRTQRGFEVLGSTAANVVADPKELRRRIARAGSESGVLGQQVVIRLDTNMD